MDIERRLYHYGLGAGLPYSALNSIANMFDEARHAPDLARRRAAAREMLENSPWTEFVSKDRGYAVVDSPQRLPGTRAALDAARAIIEDCRKTGWKARKNNPFYQCEKPEHFVAYPELLDFALSDTMLQIVCGYYGLVPQIKEIGIWLTPVQTHVFSSQFYHLDKPEGKLLKLFLNIDTHTEQNGLLTFLPADVSAKVREKTSYDSIYFRGDGRLTDEQVFSACSPADQIVLGSELGTGGFADTSACFHYGSRCKSGERKMFMITYMLPQKARDPRTPLFDLVPRPADPVRGMILSGAQFAHA